MTDTDLLVRHLSTALDTSDDALFLVDVEGRIQTWNKGAERLFGRSAESTLGQFCLDVLPGSPLVLASVCDRVLEGERIERVRLDTERTGGAPLSLSLTITPVRQSDGKVVGASAVVRDLSEQTLAQWTLADSERRLRRIEALAGTGSFVIDGANGGAQWSEGMYRVHDVDPEDIDVSFETHLALVHPDDREAVRAVLVGALSDNLAGSLDYRLDRAPERWVFLAVEPRTDLTGSVVGISGICQDVSARVRSEVATRSALDLERLAGDELRRMDHVKDEFLATVSHELRTPLTSIIGFASLLRNRGLESELVEPIERNAREMHLMIERLLDYSRLQAGRVALAPELVGLGATTRAVVERFSAQVEPGSLTVDVQEDLQVLLDRDAYDRVLGNLIGNARKYAGPTASIVVSARLDGAMAVVSVSDDGPGIEEEHREHLFEHFYRVPGVVIEGTGVGLAIVERYVGLLGGTVWCESEVGVGTTFSFTLPLAPQGADA